MKNAIVGSSLCAMGLLYSGCSDQPEGKYLVEETGSLQLGLQAARSLGPTHDVTQIQFVISRATDAGPSCALSTAVAVVNVPLETEPLPPSLLDGGGGGMHPFGDALVVLAPGPYTVCGIPLNQFGGPSSQCFPDIQTVNVIAGATTETVLVSQCQGVNSGALDAITILNNPPVITSLSITPSKFITRCETATLTATAFDPDGDSLTFTWQDLTTGQQLTAPIVTFIPPSTGDFQFRLIVRDGRLNTISGVQGTAVLTFPIHVSPCADAGTRD